MKIVGITIGPIYDTISLTSTPAALWFSSYLFSDLSGKLCKELKKDTQIKLLSPVLDESDINDGIGKYPDRIIFTTNNFDKAKLEDIIQKVKEGIVDDFFKNENIKPESKENLKNYLQINYVALDHDEKKATYNPIFAVTKHLDAIELMYTFSTNDNEIRKRFNNDKSLNAFIINSPFFNKNNNQLVHKTNNQDNRIKTIGNIAYIPNDKTSKISHYYAIISADGDKMGKFLKELCENSTTVDETNKRIEKFSTVCLKYAKDSAKLIGDYGGVTIYAGGDDLLFIAPLHNKEKNIFDLCVEINSNFKKLIKDNFKEINVQPSISFGIAVRYYKYPLYEALSTASYLLHIAKQETKNDDNTVFNFRDSMVINVEKHSGQSFEIVIKNTQYENLFKKLLAIDLEQIDSNTNLIYTLSSLHKIISPLLEQLDTNKKSVKKENFVKIMKNFFDNETQDKYGEYIGQMMELLYEFYTTPNTEESDNKTNKIIDNFLASDTKLKKSKLELFIYMLRINKLFNE